MITTYRWIRFSSGKYAHLFVAKSMEDEKAFVPRTWTETNIACRGPAVTSPSRLADGEPPCPRCLKSEDARAWEATLKETA